MSSTQSPVSPVAQEVEEPRKKGSRGGKRSVTHLSKAQLARKRANDREAQRNIRQRTKEHIENLEKRVKELEGGGRSSSLERVLRRNKELEEEVERLKEQLVQQSVSDISSQSTPDLQDEFLVTQKVNQDWVPVSVPHAVPEPEQWPTSSLPTSIPPIISTELPLLNRTLPMENQVYPISPSNYGEAEDSPQNYTPTALPVWDNNALVLGHTPSITKPPTTSWTQFHPELPRPSRFPDLPTAGFSEAGHTPTYHTTCWQAQPSTYAWQMSTKLKAPVTHLDHLMIGLIQTQRHLHATNNFNDDIMGIELPPIDPLFNQPGPLKPLKPTSNISHIMDRYAEVLSARGFALVPEKLASFACMYRFIQWQISPNYKTYAALHDWQAIQPAQLLIPHPAWMDLVPWPKLRERLIENQDLYANPEFQAEYVSCTSANFPFDITKAVEFVDGQMKISKLLDMHLSKLSNISVRRRFITKYPELEGLCRVDEI